MFQDRYGNQITTTSAKARDLYIEAVDRLLGAAPGLIDGFQAVIDEDPDFALAHSGLARCRAIIGDPVNARAAMADARALADNVSEQEASHLNAMGLLVDGKVPAGYRAIRQHVAEYPRDAMLAQTCTSVFGLIGFSGQPGREAELLAYTAGLMPHYGDDWWLTSQHAFSLCETGQVGPAADLIEKSLALNPRSGHSAHVRAHIHYEAGETAAGVRYLEGWLPDYDRSGLMHGHISWHTALWRLEAGDYDRVWQLVDDNVAPAVSKSPPLNVLTDNAAILYRLELVGVDVPVERWQAISDYAVKFFPNPGLGFADVHAALAHAMSGNMDALNKIVANPAGPAADVVRETSAAFGALAQQNWLEAENHLVVAMGDHARLGGSRAQRDILEHAMVAALLKQGQGPEAKRLLALRRPAQAGSQPVAGL
jgi:hypothetical protein